MMLLTWRGVIFAMVRRATRGLRNSPGFTTTVIASLTLGIGTSLAVFTLVSHTSLRRLPYERPNELVAIGTSGAAGISWMTMYYNYSAWREASRSLVDITWIRDGVPGSVEGSATERLAGSAAAANFLHVLRVRPAIGRWFTSQEAAQSEAVAVISNAVWRTKFGGRHDIIGRRLLRIDNRLSTIVGVLPPNAALPLNADFWVPRAQHLMVEVIGRLRGGTNVQAAVRELNLLAPSTARRGTGRRPEFVVTSLQDRLFGASGATLQRLLIAVLLTFLLACTNVANLCLVRALQRRHELAIHLALGASRQLIALQVVVENAILALSATCGAVGVSALLASVLTRVGPPELTDTLRGAHVDFRVILVAIGFAACATLVISWTPVMALLRADLRPLLGGVGPSSTSDSRSGGRLRSTFVVAQLVLALTLLVACGLLTRSMGRLLSIKVGFDRRGLVIAEVQIVDSAAARGLSRHHRVAELLRGVQSIPGVQSATVGPPPLIGGHGPILSDGYSAMFSFVDSLRVGGRRQSIWVKVVDASYLETFGIVVRAGRAMTAQDDQDAPAIAIVNASAERLLFPDGSAVGRPLDGLPQRLSAGRPVTVVGVAVDVRQRDINIPAAPEIWLPIAQQENPPSVIYISARTNVNAGVIASELRALHRSLGRAVVLRRVRTMDAVVDQAAAPQRFVMSAFVTLGAVSLTLAVLGVYAVIAHLTASRTREIGVRLALGASKYSVLWLVTRDGMRLSMFGIIVGLPLSYGWGRGLARFLYEIEPWDAVTAAAAAVILVCAATAAALVPAFRATRIDPATSLRVG